MVEKYLKISDFITYILDNEDLFLGQNLEHIQSKQDVQKIRSGYINDFLLNVQDCINFDKTVYIMIQNQVHSLIIDELFDQTDQIMKNIHNGDASISINVKVKTDRKDIFGKRARINLLVQLVNQSVEMKKYSITYEVIKRFMSDFLKAKNLPIFNILFQHFIED
jgi:ribosomal protein L9